MTSPLPHTDRMTRATPIQPKGLQPPAPIVGTPRSLVERAFERHPTSPPRPGLAWERRRLSVDTFSMDPAMVAIRDAEYYRLRTEHLDWSDARIARETNTRSQTTVARGIARHRAKVELGQITAPAPAKPATPWRVGTPKAPKPAHEPAARSYGVAGALLAMGTTQPPAQPRRRETDTPDPWANSDALEDRYAGRTTNVSSGEDW